MANVRRSSLCVSLLFPFASSSLLAQAVAPQLAQTPSLVQLVTNSPFEGYFNALDVAAAEANDAAYANLLPICGAAAKSTATCTGATQLLYNQLRALEDNANSLLGRGEQTYSLRLDPTKLANALQWTAPEEYAAQGSMTNQFANSQATVLANRFSALHFASIATRLARNSDDPSSATWAYVYQALGSGASADSSTASFGRFSAFFDDGFGAGSKNPTTFEDAFHFDSTEVSAGLDYRISDRLVAGLLLGHTERRVDFNSAESIVDGQIRGNGQSTTLYVQYEGDGPYVNGSIGSQHMTLRSVRRITYPSNNPLVPSVDETALSDAGANTLTASGAAGYVLHYRAASLEPYLNSTFVRTSIGSFVETNTNGFDVNVSDQRIDSTELAAGLKLQYAILPPFGVIVPYAYGEYRHEFSASRRTLVSTYAADSVGNASFNLPTDVQPTHYYVVGGGFSTVLPHGLQAFVQYMALLDYTNYSDHLITGGIRWEFR